MDRSAAILGLVAGLRIRVEIRGRDILSISSKSASKKNEKKSSFVFFNLEIFFHVLKKKELIPNKVNIDKFIF